MNVSKTFVVGSIPTAPVLKSFANFSKGFLITHTGIELYKVIVLEYSYMKMLIFTEGTIIMHKNAVGHTRNEIVKQVENNEESVHDFASYVPIAGAVNKIGAWKNQNTEICYLTSRKKQDEVETIRTVLQRYGFPEGELYYRKEGEEYKDVAERVMPNILIEDDCESIGGEDEMTITHINSEARQKIKSIPIKEFGGVDHLFDDIQQLL